MMNNFRLKYVLIALALICAGTSCKDEDDDMQQLENITIASGSFFGLCAGYCLTEMEITESQAILVSSAWPASTQQFPDRTCSSTISSEQWNLLMTVVNTDVFSQQDETLGCPDCADGGGEWIELRQNGQPIHRITFEFGQDVPAIQPLLNLVRSVHRPLFDECQ